MSKPVGLTTLKHDTQDFDIIVKQQNSKDLYIDIILVFLYRNTNLVVYTNIYITNISFIFVQNNHPRELILTIHEMLSVKEKIKVKVFK